MGSLVGLFFLFAMFTSPKAQDASPFRLWIHDNIPIRKTEYPLVKAPTQFSDAFKAPPCLATRTRTCFTVGIADATLNMRIRGARFTLRTKSDGNRTRTSDVNGLMTWEVTKGEKMEGEFVFIPDVYDQQIKGYGLPGPVLKTGTSCCAGMAITEIFRK